MPYYQFCEFSYETNDPKILSKISKIKIQRIGNTVSVPTINISSEDLKFNEIGSIFPLWYIFGRLHKMAENWFWAFSVTHNIFNIDFCKKINFSITLKTKSYEIGMSTLQHIDLRKLPDVTLKPVSLLNT